MRESLAEPERSAAHRRLQLLRAQSRSRADAGLCSRRSTRRPGEFVRPALVRALAALAVPATTTAPASGGCSCAKRPRGGFLPQRRHRGARRLQGAVRVRRARGDREARRSAAGRRGARAREDRRQARARDCWPRCSGRRRGDAARPSPRPSVCSASTARRTRTILVETLKFADENRRLSGILRAAAAGPRRARRRRPDAQAPLTRCSTSAFRRAIRRARRWRSRSRRSRSATRR